MRTTIDQKIHARAAFEVWKSEITAEESIRNGQREREAVARAEREAALRRVVAGDRWLGAGE
jgi:hypothetical protein